MNCKGVVYIVQVKPESPVAKEIWSHAQVVGVLCDDDNRVRIWARGAPPGLKSAESEMYLLSAYHRAKDFLEGRITMATFSGSWELAVEDTIGAVIGTVGAPGTRRELPMGVANTPEVRELLRDWLSKPAIIKT